MSSLRDPADGGVGARLRADLQQAGFTIRGFARHLAGGPDATRDEVESWRRYISRWLTLDGHRGMTPQYAEMVAGALGTDPGNYLSRQYDERQQLERRAQRLEAQLRELREQLDQR